ncbi:MAG TPA: sigma-70 family RNA polymerase sigma factor [Flavilitoribacter sp.]|nr:sigma-70 family RNA polymerase sigma factor [Flavilitoribacter sp.]HMQ88672.1 sigma-70 family RNA polymerase sigma factor [Flavilitoribacter sp.]
MPGESAIEQEFIARIRQHQGILHKIGAVYAHSAADREDLQQEIILQLWKSYPAFRGKSAFSTWMYRVALNTAITFTRKAAFFREHTERLSAAADVGITTEYSEDLKLLYLAIARLNKVERAIILLWLEEKPYQEIADTLGMTEKNVSVRLVRIKAKLAAIIETMQ